MRGKNYNDGSRRLPGGSPLGVVLIVLALAVALTFILLLYLPLTDETNKAGVMGSGDTREWNNIVSIEYSEKEIGVGSEKDKIYLTVTYNDGTKEDVALSQMICSGLDVTTSGTQNVSLSYGGFEQTIPITVKDVNCVLNYSASDGGRIQGESRQSIVSGHDGSTVVAVPETGYTFVEWNDGYPYATRKDKNVNETREYKAIFEKTQFVVFFFYDDGTVAREDTVLYGEAATDIPKISDPRMSVYGKTFQGWSVSEDDFKCVVRNMNVYPQYIKTATDVNVTVESDQYGSHMGTTNANEFGYYEHNSTASITATPYNSREFDCWKVWGYPTADANNAEWIEVPKKSATGEATVLVYIGDNREVCTFTSNSTGNAGTEYTLTFVPNAYMDTIDIRANFVYNNSTVTFINYQNSVKNNQECVIADIPYGTTLGAALAEKVTTEDGADLNLNSDGMLVPASVYGYTFLGWYDKLDEEQSIVTVNKIFREPTSLIAKWEKLVYTVVFDYSTADNSDLDYQINVVFQNTIGSGGGVPMALPYRAKYNFIGWEDALTHDLIDDTTQISVKEEYLTANKNFVDERKIYVSPRWEAKEHVLRVQSAGSGTVYLRIHPLVGPTEEVAVTGEVIIYETYTYELVFRADVGYYVSSYVWQFENDVPIKQNNVSEAVSPIPKSDGNNIFTVTFSPIVYTATIFNGDAVYRGYVEGVVGSDADTATLDVHYGDTVSLSILSPNEAYEISDIRVTGRIGGVMYNDESVENGLAGSHTLHYNLLLENCTSNLGITIKYDSVSYTVNVSSPDNASIDTTVFNGTESDRSPAPALRDYAPNEKVFYVIEAEDGYYISDVRLNGMRYDVYGSVGNEVVFYDWEVNGQSYGVTLKYIGGEYYYSYGSAVYDGVTYMYCRNAADGEERIFIVLDEVNERYESVDAEGANNAAIPAEYYEELSKYLIKACSVNEKGIGNASVEKDRRVTKVKLMLLPGSNVNFSVSADLIYYSFTVKENAIAVSSVSASSVLPGATVTVKTKPITGYTVTGYYVNGGDYTPVSLSSPELTFDKDFVNVDKDYIIEFTYDLITYSANFEALVNGTASVREEGSGDVYLLTRSHSFDDLKFASKVSYVITAADGKKITSLTVNGTAYPVVHNMTSYLFVCQSVRGSLTIKIGCADLVPTEPAPGGYELQCETPTDNQFAYSVKYEGGATYLTVLAEDGYYLHSVTVHGKLTEGGEDKSLTMTLGDNAVGISDATGSGVTSSDFSYLADAATSYKKAFTVQLPGTLFWQTAKIKVNAEKEYYTITVETPEHGTISAVPGAPYNTDVLIGVSAAANYYIDSLEINGVVIPFAASGWSGLSFNTDVRQYVKGDYTLVLTGDTTIKAIFKIYAYTVRLDPESVNGTTSLHVEGMTEDGKAPYDSSLTISMTAARGYHIKAVYVNGRDIGYDSSAYGENENNVTNDIMVYTNITQNISVRVYYEINRYSFTYSVVNDSANFAGAAGSGTLTAEYTPVGTNKYTGIAYGDNFCVNVTPAASAGYYLYSMSITYKGYSDDSVKTKTRYYYDGDGIISKAGSTVWFNRFWFADSAGLATGITADVENVTVTFKREIYSLSLTQNTIGGGLTASFVNPSVNAGDYVIVYGRASGTTDDLTEYYYETAGARFFKKVGSQYMDTGIVLTYRTGTLGDVVFSDGNKEYDMYFEYGIRCSVIVRPDAGYDRVGFTVNGEDRIDYVSSDQYNFNFYRSTMVGVSYLVQEFDIGLKAVIYTDKNSNQKITAASGKSNEYINVVISVLNERGEVIRAYSKEPQSLALSKTLPYGTIVRYDIESKFASKGVYLYNLTQTTIGADGNPVVSEIRTIDGDVEGLVSFGPFVVTGELTLNAYFEIRSYTVTTEIAYDEELNNETRNTARRDTDSSKTSWSVFWGTATAVSVDIDDGFSLYEIVVTTGGRTYVLSSVNPGRDTDAVYYREGVEDPTYGVRNLLYISSVKDNANVKVSLRRREFISVYNLNNSQSVDSVDVHFNEYSSIYPRSTKNPDAAWQVAVRYYDELRVVVTPKDGYEIVAQLISIYRAVWDDSAGLWVKESSVPLINLDFTPVSGDIKQFTFHPSNGYALISVNGDIIVDISVTIKRYKLESTVIRTDAASDISSGKNDTVVSLNVYTSPTDYSFITVNGSSQQTQILNKNVVLNQSYAQHGSLILYEFITPDGYMMDTFTMNGLTLEDMRGYATLTAGKYGADPTRYQYRIAVTVCTDLVNGASGFFKSSPDLISVKMTLSPIVYDVVIVINQTVEDFGTYNERSGVTDERTLTVYSAKNVVHFSSINIEPTLFEGYKIDATDAYVGTSDSTSALIKASFGTDQETLNVRKRFTFDSVSLDKADVTLGRNTVYFFFTTSIIYYRLQVDSVVYYSEAGSLRTDTLATYNQQNTNKAGRVECAVSNLIVQSAGAYSDTGALNAPFPYFSTVTVEASASSDFALFAVYENINGTWQTVRDNVNGLSYVSRKEGSLTTYYLTFTIDSVGDRMFKVDFKQRTSITVNVPNPYKYVAGASNTYLYYSSVSAYESDVETETGEYVDPRSTSEGIVKTQYVFTVYVGNYFSIRFTDTYRRSSTVNFTVYSADMSAVAESCIENSYVNGVFNTERFKTMYDTLSLTYEVGEAKYGGSKNENKRHLILGGEVFYVYDNDVYGHVAAEKLTVDATSASGSAGSVGGRIYYNTSSSESRNNVIYEDTLYGTTKEGKVLTVVCEAEPNYVFYRMLFRQIDTGASRNAGYVKFGNTDTNSWREMTFTSASDRKTDALDAFNANNTNGYVLLNFRQSGNKYYFTIWMNGDVEMKAEFYRTYSVSYAVYLPDVVATGVAPTGSGITAEDVSDTVFTVNNVGPFASGGDRVSYGSEFRMTVAPQASNYIFVGWYVNDVDLFTSLDKLVPGADYYTQRFIVDFDNMEALIKDGQEVAELVIYARFEPVIDVQLINEKYYAYDYHFNSWDMGTLQSVYYNYSRAQQEISGISLSSHTEVTEDTEGMSITNGLLYIESLDAFKYEQFADLTARPADWSTKYASYYVKNNDGTYTKNTSSTWDGSKTYASLVRGKGSWSDFYSDAVVNAYSTGDKNGYRIYTAAHAFTVLLENVVDGDYINNTWTTSNIELYMTGMDSDVGFSSWQYYNWNTGLWVTIPYEYVDLSYGVSADGSLYRVDAYTSEYVFSLSALYAGAMPYAISAVNANNLGGDRPLMIRPDLYKFFEVNLLQYAFSNSYTGLGDVDERVLSGSIVSPLISDFTPSNPDFADDRNYTSDDGTTGSYEYGTRVELIYNQSPNKEVYNSSRSIRYRFIGWYVKLAPEDTVYYLDGSNDTSGNAFSYQLICSPTYSETSLMLMSYYVAQYKQEFYSYGISGSETKTYSANAGLRSGKAAPKGYIVAQTSSPISVPTATMAGGAVKYNNSNVVSTITTEYVRVSGTSEIDGECPTLSSNGSNYNTSSNAVWTYEYYMDAGLEYTLYVNKNTALISTANIKNFRNNWRNDNYNYFNPEFDTLYKLFVDSASETVQDFSDYYNTGNGTYWVDGAQRTASYLTTKALNENGWESGHHTFVCGSTHKVDLQYITTATLIFYNMMYGSGISIVNSDFVRALTGGKKSALTVWDNSTLYGDWLEGGDEPSFLKNNANDAKPIMNGEVVIRVTLNGITEEGFADNVLYALNGMQEGRGIPSQTWVYDMSGSKGLFSPSNAGYGRWLEYDLNDYYTGNILSNTRVFGGAGFLTNSIAHMSIASAYAPRSETRKIGNHLATPDYYNTTYCGLGTADNPYKVFILLPKGEYYGVTRITDNKELEFISKFWRYNDYSCQDDNGYQVRFKIYTSDVTYIKVDGSEDHLTGIGPGGIINLQGIDVRQAARGNPQGSSDYIWKPLCVSTAKDEEGIKGFDGIFDFSNCRAYALAVGDNGTTEDIYYGMFGKVCNGGTINNLTFVNGFFNNDGVVEYLGLVCGYAEDAYFDNINFQLIPSQYNGFTDATYQKRLNDNREVYGTSLVAGVFMSGPKYVGALFGYGKKCYVNNVTINSNNSDAAYAEVNAELYGGLLIGAIEGGSVKNVTVNNNIWIASDTFYNVTNVGASGGLFGYAGGVATLRENNLVCNVEDELIVGNVRFDGTATIIVGKEVSSVSGGMFGVVGYGATVAGITFRTSTSSQEFYVDDEAEHSATSGILFLRADVKSVSTKGLKAVTTYGFVGAIAGLNYGTIHGGRPSNVGNTNGSYVYSYVFTYAGTAGGLVGGNFGTISDFSLGGGFRLYAWEPLEGNLSSFNYGGIAGFNYEGSEAYVSFLESKANNARGLINACRIEGVYQSDNGYTGSAGWNTASVYVFPRSDMSDTGYRGSNLFIATGSRYTSGDSYNRVMNKNNYIDNQSYLCVGGICGYSTGRIYNCLTKNLRVSVPRWRYSYDSLPDSLGKYTWEVSCGLICGRFDPTSQTIKGWTDYSVPDDNGEFSGTSSTVYNNNRIQSCVVDTCSVNINGNVWMDDKWAAATDREGNGDDISRPIGISIAGIAGSVSSTAANCDFAVNSCKVVNLKIYSYFQTYGRTNEGGSNGGDIGWYTWKTKTQDKDFFHDEKWEAFARCLRPYCLFELNIAAISSGLSNDGKNEDSGYAEYCHYASTNIYFTPHSDNKNTMQDRGEVSAGWYFGWGAGDVGPISNPSYRYIKYNDDVWYEKSYEASSVMRDFQKCRNGCYTAISTSGYSYGFKNGQVIATDPDTGYLYCVYKDGEEMYAYYDTSSRKWKSSDVAPTTSFSTVG